MEIAGNPHRVHDITVAELDADPDLRVRVGPSIDALARQRFPEPYFDNTHTRGGSATSPPRSPTRCAPRSTGSAPRG